MNTLQLDPEQKIAVESEVIPLFETAKALTVKNPDQRAIAVSFIKQAKEAKEKIEERFHPTKNKQTAYKHYEDLLLTEKAFYAPIDEAVKIVNETVKKFDLEESKRVQREAEEAEAKRRADERKQQEKLEKKAEKAEGKGNIEQAEVLREQAANVNIAPTFIPPAQTKKLIWKARVINPLKACKSISEGLIPFNAVEFKQSALNDLGKAYDGKSVIPGIEFYQDVSSRI